MSGESLHFAALWVYRVVPPVAAPLSILWFGRLADWRCISARYDHWPAPSSCHFIARSLLSCLAHIENMDVFDVSSPWVINNPFAAFDRNTIDF
jgi:hypothetical protein